MLQRKQKAPESDLILIYRTCPMHQAFSIDMIANEEVLRPPKSRLTQQAASYLIHVSPSLQRVKPQNDDMKLFIEFNRFLFYSAEMRGDLHA